MDDANDELLIRLLLANGLEECDDAVARIQTLKAERDRFADRHERHLILGAEVRARAEKAEAELAASETKLALAVEALKEIEDGWTAAADDDTGELVAVRVSDDEMVKIARAALAQIKGE